MVLSERHTPHSCDKCSQSPVPCMTNKICRQMYVFIPEFARFLGDDAKETHLCNPVLKKELWKLLAALTVFHTWYVQIHHTVHSTDHHSPNNLAQFWFNGCTGISAYMYRSTFFCSIDLIFIGVPIHASGTQQCTHSLSSDQTHQSLSHLLSLFRVPY